MSEQKYGWVMLKKYDPQKGNVRQRVRMPEEDWGGLVFEPEVVHRLPWVNAKWLHENVHQRDGVGSERTPLAFHLWTSYEAAKRGWRDLKMAEMGRVQGRRGAVAVNKPPPLVDDGHTITTIGDPEPVHELEMDPPEFPDEVVDSVPLSLGDVDVAQGYDSVAPPTEPASMSEWTESEKPKKTRKKPGPKPGSKRKPRAK